MMIGVMPSLVVVISTSMIAITSPFSSRMAEAKAIPAASRTYVCWTSECNALTAASRLATGTNRLTECGDNTYLSGTIP